MAVATSAALLMMFPTLAAPGRKMMLGPPLDAPVL
jgi:hypothetical protein